MDTRNMTKQETFDIVAAHLLTQRAKSLRPSRHLPNSCAYRGEGGRKCAVGVLIADADYVARMEGNAVTDLLQEWPDLPLPSVGGLLRNLQEVHDDFDVDQWPAQLYACAVGWQLSAAVVDSFTKR